MSCYSREINVLMAKIIYKSPVLQYQFQTKILFKAIKTAEN